MSRSSSVLPLTRPTKLSQSEQQPPGKSGQNNAKSLTRVVLSTRRHTHTQTSATEAIKVCLHCLHNEHLSSRAVPGATDTAFSRFVRARTRLELGRLQIRDAISREFCEPPYKNFELPLSKTRWRQSCK